METLVIVFLVGVIAITIKGGWEMQKKIDRLEQYAVLITHFSHEISELPKEEVGKKLEAFLKKNGGTVRVTREEE